MCGKNNSVEKNNSNIYTRFYFKNWHTEVQQLVQPKQEHNAKAIYTLLNKH